MLQSPSYGPEHKGRGPTIHTGAQGWGTGELNMTSLH